MLEHQNFLLGHLIIRIWMPDKTPSPKSLLSNSDITLLLFYCELTEKETIERSVKAV